MTTPIRSKIVKIGNSQGVRISRALLEQADLSGDVLLSIEDNKLIIQSVQKPRHNWAGLFQAMTSHGDDQMLENPTSTEWDEEEWEWE